MDRLTIKVELSDDTKPKLFIRTETQYIRTLLDTGSDTAVWCAPEEQLKNAFPNAKPTKYKIAIAGFGEGIYIAKIWKIPEFKIEDSFDNNTDSKTMTIKNMLVAVHPAKKFDFKLILASTTFDKVNYTIHNNPKDQKYLAIETDRDNGIYGYTAVLLSDEKRNQLSNLFRNKITDSDILIDHTVLLYKE